MNNPLNGVSKGLWSNFQFHWSNLLFDITIFYNVDRLVDGPQPYSTLDSAFFTLGSPHCTLQCSLTVCSNIALVVLVRSDVINVYFYRTLQMRSCLLNSGFTDSE